VLENLRGDEAVRVAEFAVEGVEQRFVACLQSFARIGRDLFRCLPGKQCLDRPSGRLAVDVTHHVRQADAAVGEYLVQAVVLPAEDAGEFLQLP